MFRDKHTKWVLGSTTGCRIDPAASYVTQLQQAVERFSGCFLIRFVAFSLDVDSMKTNLFHCCWWMTRTATAVIHGGRVGGFILLVCLFVCYFDIKVQRLRWNTNTKRKDFEDSGWSGLRQVNRVELRFFFFFGFSFLVVVLAGTIQPVAVIIKWWSAHHLLPWCLLFIFSLLSCHQCSKINRQGSIALSESAMMLHSQDGSSIHLWRHFLAWTNGDVPFFRRPAQIKAFLLSQHQTVAIGPSTMCFKNSQLDQFNVEDQWHRPLFLSKQLRCPTV